MNHIVNTIKGTIQAFFIANVADKETNTRITLELFGHIPLFHFISGEDDDLFRVVLGQGHWHEGIPERASTACDENGFVGEHLTRPLVAS
ncbi:hypothetical protein D3C80_1843340 [compost metagenome]